MLKNFLKVFLAGFLCAGLTYQAQARQTGTNTDPETCFGAASYEACLDSTGNWVPTTTNNAGLGISSLRWANLYSVLGNFSGTLTTTGISNTGALTVSGNTTHSTNVIDAAQTPMNVSYSSVTYSPTGSFQVIWSTGNITLYGVPTFSTATATEGQWLTLLSTQSVITIQDQTTITGSGIDASAAAVTITTVTPVHLIFYRGAWHKI